MSTANNETEKKTFLDNNNIKKRETIFDLIGCKQREAGVYTTNSQQSL